MATDPAVEYNFDNEVNFAFYILNAVAHDFIHDFNNYKRMNKILDDIMLLGTSISVVSTSDYTASTSIMNQLAEAAEEARELAEAQEVAAEEQLAQSAARASAKRVRPENKSNQSQQLKQAQERASEQEIAARTAARTARAEARAEARAALNAAIKEENNDIAYVIDNTTTEPTSTESSTYEMFQSQIETVCSDEEISMPIERTSSGPKTQQVYTVVQNNIGIFNRVNQSLTATLRAGARITRGMTKKLYFLQRVKDFVQEGIFLIISKLQPQRTFGGGKRKIRKQTGGSRGIDIIQKSDIIDSINDIIREITAENSEDENLMSLINVFQYIKYSFIYLSIPNISPLEILSNSLIEDNTCIFIVGQCNDIDIEKQAELTLTALLSSSQDMTTPIIQDRTLLTADGKDGKMSGIMTPKNTPYKTPITSEHLKETIKQVKETLNSNNSSMPSNEYSLNRFYEGSMPIAVRAGGSFRKTRGGQRGGAGGTALNKEKYKNSKDLYDRFYDGILDTNNTYNFKDLYDNNTNTNFRTDDKATELYHHYSLDSLDKDIIKQIAGEQTFNVKDKTIKKSYDQFIQYRDASSRAAPRMANDYKNEFFDTIIDLIIHKTIKHLEGIMNRSAARISPSSSEGRSSSSISGEARDNVQKISKMLAFKVLELTGLGTHDDSGRITPVQLFGNGNNDLNKQIELLANVANDTKYTVIDEQLLKHFLDNSVSGFPIIKGLDAFNELERRVNSCNKTKCRIINNAIPAKTKISKILKATILKSIVCPTSSVCDAMNTFGSCVPLMNPEYKNMNYYISYPVDNPNYYLGQTNIKPNNNNVNVRYGYNYNGLNIYNDINICLTKPVLLKANYVFKNLIEEIIEIWKKSSVTEPSKLWEMLYNTKIFSDILKLGSQKSIGDIFQEINSTLANGGYEYSNRQKNPDDFIANKFTYGLMGDRPSGIRVIKLLMNPANLSMINPNASGGYISEGETQSNNNSLIYFSPPPPVRGGGRKNGGKITRKKRKMKTKRYQKSGRRTKRKGKHNRKSNKNIKLHKQ
jgi:hypothetical protein